MAALLLAFGVAATVLIPPDRDDYLAVISDKVAMLDGAPSPKIVFVGGSNLAFGLDSRRIEQETGYTVVNMGMGFNMGLRFMLDLVAPRIHDGDVVVIVPEYNLFYGLFDGNERLVDVLEMYPPGLAYIHSRRQVSLLLRNLPRHVTFKVNRFLQTLGHERNPNCVYCPRAFDEHGDVTAHLDLPSKDVAKMDFLTGSRLTIDDSAIAGINAFARGVEARGARVVMLFPCIPTVHYERKRELIERLYQRLQSELKVPLLSAPVDYTFPIEDFYDWVYHLDRKGRQERTTRVLDDLRPVLDKRGNG